METKLAGSCPVDSGQIMVIDPCYALMDEYDDTGGNYRTVCNSTTNGDGYGEFPLPRNGYNQSIGVATSSGYGDGCYPVYVDVNNDNRVVALHIYFDGLELELDYA
jgi:hypothetical protein